MRPQSDPVVAPAKPDLGAEFQPMVGEHLDDPYPFYARARREEPVFFSPMFGLWFVTRYDDIVSVLRDPATYSSRDTVPTHPEMALEVQQALRDYRHPQHLINSDPPGHTRLRSLLNQGFAPGRVAALEPSIRQVADALIDAFIDDGHADLVAQLAYPLPLTVILRMLGVPAEDMDACRRCSEDITTWAWGASSLPVETLVSCARGMVAFQDYAEALVETRRREPRDDMISQLLQAHEDGQEPLGTEELVSLLPGLILAGHETTANLIANTTRLLLSDPDGWKLVRSDPPAVERAVEEGLRMDTSVTGMIRTVTRPVELGRVSLPAEARLFLLFGSANHDESRYSHPEEFRLDRPKEAPNLSFGRGIHFCIGAPLGRLEARVAIEQLTTRLPEPRLADQRPERRPILLFRGFTRLGVTWDRS